MSEQSPKSTGGGHGIVAHPLESLVFLLPFLAFYELVAPGIPGRLVVLGWIRWFFNLFGDVSAITAPLTVVAILVASHAATGQKWRVRIKPVLLMYVEAAALALPLVAVSGVLDQHLSFSPGRVGLHELALSVGAGVYEELVFRLVLMSFIVILFHDGLGISEKPVAIAAIIISALLFTAHHYAPIGREPLRLDTVIFRSVAGLYLATIFWYRGYGPAAGCHALYNIALCCFA